MTLYTHDAPFLKINNINNLRLFLKKNKIEINTDRSQLINEIANAFSKIPYENLTKIIKSDGVITPRSAMRYPDELLSDYLKWRTGGTCFSLTAATIAVYNAVGIEAHPVLADRHYGPDTHCGLVIVIPEGL
jgi:arylamine N-acetyltransferase